MGHSHSQTEQYGIYRDAHSHSGVILGYHYPTLMSRTANKQYLYNINQVDCVEKISNY